MKLYSKNTGKFTLALWLGLMMTVLCAFLLFGGVANMGRQVFADETSSSTVPTIDNSLDEFTANDLTKDTDGATYLINSVDDLRSMAYYVNNGTEISEGVTYASASYKLTCDLDLSNIKFWVAIGTETNPFTGVFNGNGYSIYGLTIIEDKPVTTDETRYEYRGLFGYVKYGGVNEVEIKNLGLKDTLIQAHAYWTGGLIAYAEGSSKDDVGKVKVTECYNTGYVEGDEFVGGLIGQMISGAYMKNCYFTGTVLDLNRFGSNVVNENFDVATNVIDSFVGGLVGYAEDDGKTKVIESCYSASRVGGKGVSNDEISRGALVGNVANGFSSGLHQRYNFFLTDLFSTDVNNQGAIRISASALKKSSFTAVRGFDADYASSDEYLPSNPTKTWQWSSTVNNGLPFLKNTQQLVRIEFVNQNVSDTNNVTEIITSKITSTIASNDKICLTKKIDGDKTQYFVRIVDGTGLNLVTNVAEKSDADYTYKFSKWDRDVTLPTFINAKSMSSMPISYATSNTTAGCADMDKVFVAKYVEREYSISLTASGDKVAESLSISVGDTVSTSQTGDTTITSSVKVKFYTENVKVSAVAKSGYYLASFATTLTSENCVDEEGNLNIADYIKAIDNTADNTMASPLSVVANFAPESYRIFTISNIESCSHAGYVKNNETPLSDNSIIKYNETLTLIIDPLGIATNYKFSYWEYQAVNAGSAPEAYSGWTPIDSDREDSIIFTVPDLVDGQSLYLRANFKKVSYTISLTEPDVEVGQIWLQNYSGDVISDREFDYDENVYIAIKANAGYEYDSVIINGKTCSVGVTGPLSYGTATWDNTNELITMTLSENTTIAVNFKKQEFDVNVKLATQNYSSSKTNVFDDNYKSLLNSTRAVLYNDALNFSIQLEEGYEIAEVTSTSQGATETLVPLGDFYVATITSNTTITVTVSKKSFEVTAHFAYYEDGYDYSVEPSCILGTGTYYYGSELQMSVDLPEMFEIDCWVFNGIKDKCTSITNSRASITQAYDVEIVLKLKEAKITLGQIGDNHDKNSGWYTLYANDEEYALNTNTDDITVKYGDIVRLKVDKQYDEGQARSSIFNFAYWQINKKAVSQSKEYAFTVNQDVINIEAVFKPAQVEITANCYVFDNTTQEVTLYSDAGTILGINSSTVGYGTPISLKAQAKDGYKFIHWKDANGNVLDGAGVNGEEYSFIASSKTDIRAVFIKIRAVNVICDANEGVITGAQKWNVGDIVTVTATANKGYKFVAWTENGETVATTNTYTFQMIDEDKKLMAVFERLYVIGFSTNDNSLGQIKGNTSGCYNERVTLEAISANNCSFVGWMVNNVMISNSAKLDISLNGDIEVQALFKKNFDWNIIIVILGSAIFAIVMVCGAIAFIKSREAQPVNTRPLIGSKDDSDIIRKSSKRNALRDEIAPVPTRKIQRTNVQPIPVRKIAVEPTDHKGNKVKPSAKAKDKKATLKTED